MKKALIFGVTGQDGAYLARLLIDKGYEVHGVKRRSSSFNTQRIDEIYVTPIKEKQFFLHFGDLADAINIFRLINEIQPEEIYNLGAMSHVRVSFDIPEYTANVDGLGTIRILEAIRASGLVKKTRYYQASSSELFGMVQEVPQKETTPFYPRSPYAVAKLYAFWASVNYREAYGIFASNGILFNHESPLRGETFVTRKISRAVGRISNGSTEVLSLGCLESKRDWGYAPEYVEGMWQMLQVDEPDDFILATGETHSIRDFVEASFAHVGINIEWRGQKGALDETGVDSRTGRVLVDIDPIYFRPTEVDLLLGDYSKAKSILGWEPRTSFTELVKIMTDYDRKDPQNLKFVDSY